MPLRLRAKTDPLRETRQRVSVSSRVLRCSLYLILTRTLSSHHQSDTAPTINQGSPRQYLFLFKYLTCFVSFFQPTEEDYDPEGAGRTSKLLFESSLLPRNFNTRKVPRPRCYWYADPKSWGSAYPLPHPMHGRTRLELNSQLETKSRQNCIWWDDVSCCCWARILVKPLSGFWTWNRSLFSLPLFIGPDPRPSCRNSSP